MYFKHASCVVLNTTEKRMCSNITPLLLGTKCEFEHEDLQYLVTNLKHMSNFHLLEVEDCRSKTQLQVGDLKKVI